MKKVTYIISIIAIVVFAAFKKKDSEWTYLIGKKLDKTWIQRGGKAKFEIKDGILIGTSIKTDKNSFMCTAKDYSDFVIEYEYKCHNSLNSGVQFRSNSIPEYKEGRVHGYQCEIDPNRADRYWMSAVYDEARTGWLYPKDNPELGKKFTEQGKRIYKRDGWNSARIKCQGNKIQTWLNGELRADFEDSKTASGFFGFQVHSTGSEEPMLVMWRNIRIKEL